MKALFVLVTIYYVAGLIVVPKLDVTVKPVDWSAVGKRILSTLRLGPLLFAKYRNSKEKEK